ASVPAEIQISWCAPGLEDLESVFVSEGVIGGPLIRAMTAAHSALSAACVRSHRRAPGAREARAWAAAAGALLRRGRPLGAALAAGWRQAYVRGFAVTGHLAAEAQAAFDALCIRLGLPYPSDAAAAQHIANGGPAAALHVTAAAEAAAAELWPQQLARPCAWPAALPLARPPAPPRLSAAARDAALLGWLLAQAFALEVAALDTGSAAAAPADASLLERLARLPVQQRALLPADLAAPAGAPGPLRPRRGGAAAVQLPALALAAAAALVCRGGPGDWGIRAMLAEAAAGDVEGAAAALSGGRDADSAGAAAAAGCAALARMAAA
ncbi:hypothetical protein MNEG_16719, partial [Monoraphidium neglectum]